MAESNIKKDASDAKGRYDLIEKTRFDMTRGSET